MYVTDEPVVAVLDTEKESKTVVVTPTGAREHTLRSTAKVNINVNGINIPTYLQVLKSVDKNLLLGTDWFQKARAMVDLNKQKLVIRYLDKRFEVPIMHTDKGKQKEYVNEDMRSGDHDGDKNDDDDLFEEFEYKSKDLEEVESYSTDSISVDEVSKNELKGRIYDENIEEESPAVCLAVMEEVPTEKKVSVDEKPPVKDQLVRIVDGNKYRSIV
ncbi:8453_t:CDS:2 [Cetraspora pellucida]|uniref:8453_t:CDS:1 n=1 Tax=Cetraspora pellucida TaxID=1433469 RepID=A0A9N9J2E5_9GLOM|nr:8453_t:CDS:2 [Cetraspora pellucida]